MSKPILFSACLLLASLLFSCNQENITDELDGAVHAYADLSGSYRGDCRNRGSIDGASWDDSYTRDHVISVQDHHPDAIVLDETSIYQRDGFGPEGGLRFVLGSSILTFTPEGDAFEFNWGMGNPTGWSSIACTCTQ